MDSIPPTMEPFLKDREVKITRYTDKGELTETEKYNMVPFLSYMFDQKLIVVLHDAKKELGKEYVSMSQDFFDVSVWPDTGFERGVLRSAFNNKKGSKITETVWYPEPHEQWREIAPQLMRFLGKNVSGADVRKRKKDFGTFDPYHGKQIDMLARMMEEIQQEF